MSTEIKAEHELEGYVSMTISMRPEDIALLDMLAKERRLSRSAFVRQLFTQWIRDLAQKYNPPQAGVYTDVNGNLVHSGLLDDAGKAKVASGVWVLKKSF